MVGFRRGHPTHLCRSVEVEVEHGLIIKHALIELELHGRVRDRVR
eukprot:COSAG01_NODE_2824_length_7006_cov_2.795714_2_plen_45_part_00